VRVTSIESTKNKLSISETMTKMVGNAYEITETHNPAFCKINGWWFDEKDLEKTLPDYPEEIKKVINEKYTFDPHNLTL
jgi:hypothetical protein